LLQWSHDPEVAVAVKIYPHLVPLDNARCMAVKEFLEDYWDFLCFVDDDIVPPLNCLRELLTAEKDIIAPVCLTMKRDDEGFVFPMPVAHRYNSEGKYQPYYGTGVEETDVVTGGMHLVRREVYEKMDRPYAFTYHANGLVIYSEDFYFSQQCQRLGYKLFTHFGLLCKHFGQVDFRDISATMARYIRQQEVAA